MYVQKIILNYFDFSIFCLWAQLPAPN